MSNKAKKSLLEMHLADPIGTSRMVEKAASKARAEAMGVFFAGMGKFFAAAVVAASRGFCTWWVGLYARQPRRMPSL